MKEWRAIVPLTEIPRLGARMLQTDTLDIALFRASNDEVFALKDSCPHQGGPLSQGLVHGNAVSCPLHNWKIDLQSGEVLGPDEGCVNTFAVKVVEGMVYLSLPVESFVV
ncbi:MAG: nitrite reductase small subunit NirD [bacterium]|nr:nitrite reductase small subunit NirD [bacterium]